MWNQAVWRAQAFGQQSAHARVGLDGPQPYAVTAVLATCLQDAHGGVIEEAEIWQWNIVRRLQALLHIAGSSGIDTLEVTRPCSRCQQIVSFDLPLTQFEREEPAAALRCTTPSGENYALRLPTGNDQRRWLQGEGATPESMALDLLEEPPSESDDLLPAIEAVLADVDPYTALVLSSACPYCEAELRIPFDLEAELLRRFRARQTERLREVHRLARAYHWSENDILTLPASRRAFYLACVEAERTA